MNRTTPLLRSILLVLASFIALGSTFIHLPSRLAVIPDGQTSQTNIAESTPAKPAVLGVNTQTIYISGGSEGFAGGGFITLASTDDPSIRIGGYNLSKPVDITIYKADQNTVLNYLTHDKDNKQTIKPDPSNLSILATTSIQVPSSGGAVLTLPNNDSNIWFVRAKYDKTTADSLVLRSGFGVLAKEGDNELIFWGQDFQTGKSIGSGDIRLMNFLNGQKEIAKASFGSDGLVKLPLSADADIALVTRGADFVVVPLNLRYLNVGYSYAPYHPKSSTSRYFSFTDRPLYRPGDKIYFKSVIRDDDDVRYTIPTGNATVKVYDGQSDKPFFEKTLAISADGTVFGDLQLGNDAKTGDYTMDVLRPDGSSSYSFFQVDFFRKPEYSVDLNIDKTQFISGDPAAFHLSGNYFSGQPLAGAKVNYVIYAANYYEYDFWQSNLPELGDDYRYGFWGGEKISESSVTLDNNGQATIDLDTASAARDGHSKVYAVEVNYDSGSGNPAFARKNVLVLAGDYGIYRKDSIYSAVINSPVNFPVTLIQNRKTNLSSVDLTAKIHREEWVATQQPGEKYPVYNKVEEDLPSLTTKTDSSGNAVFKYTPAKLGSYRLSVEGHDGRNNLIAKDFYIYVTDQNFVYYGSSNNNLNLTLDKASYLPNETARLEISSTLPDRDIFLSLERGRVNRFQIIHLAGKSTSVNLPLTATDTPNIYAVASSFSKDWLDTNSVNIVVPANHKRLTVRLTPDRPTYGPSDTVNLNVETTDSVGNPVTADLAVWSVDKALFELVDDRPQKIFDAFWSTRYDDTLTSHSLEGVYAQGGAERGGCFTAGTQILMADGHTKPIEKIKTGDSILTRTENNSQLIQAKVSATYTAQDNGYVIINGTLQVTPDHILRVNDSWSTAGSVQIGDFLIGADGHKIKVTSYEYQRSQQKVYNLEVDKYHTFFADGFYVHNQKGGGRTVFKDTAYWNPAVHTDINGRAKITFKLPDNLTTWVIAAVGDTVDTKVGQTTADIVVSKNVIVRPNLPNILRVGDDIILTAQVQNFTSTDQNFDISLNFDAGQVDNANLTGVLIKSRQTREIAWSVKVTNEKDLGKLTFSAKSETNPNDNDSVTNTLPVRTFGFLDQTAVTGNGSVTFPINITSDVNKTKSSVTLYLSPSILGTLPVAMNYLIGYPYGCVEQTTSRLATALIAKTNKSIFSDVFANANIDDIVNKSIKRLTDQEQSNGGWSWWWAGRSDPFITAYVLQNVSLAKSLGYEVPQELIVGSQGFLQAGTSASDEDSVIRAYGLSLFKQSASTGLPRGRYSPDIQALLVLANLNLGNKDPQSNGLTTLLNQARPQGDGLYWDAGTKEHFGSVDVSTALALQAIVASGSNRDIAVKAANFLIRNRKADYWSHTFGTLQVIRGVTDLAKTGQENQPNYTYAASLDGKSLKSEAVKESLQSIKPIVLPLKDIKTSGSVLKLTQDGPGQLYSTLVSKEYHTDKNAKAVDHGLKVTREYTNDKGDQYSLAVGDLVTVKITISGLTTPESYAVIEDSLPSGLIPVNTGFKNEQFVTNPDSYYTEFGVSDRDYTENGAILSLYRMNSGIGVYSYKARVISAGTFAIPPVTASLMYSPEISGRSDAQVLKIASQSQIIPGKAIEQAIQTANPQTKLILAILSIVVPLVLIVLTFVSIRLISRRRQPKK